MVGTSRGVCSWEASRNRFKEEIGKVGFRIRGVNAVSLLHPPVSACQMHTSRLLRHGRLSFGRGRRIAQMTIEPLDRELARARQILGAWTGFRRLSSDEADVIVRMIAQGIAEGRKYGLELAGAEWPTDGKNHVEELEDGLGAKARAILAEVA